MKLSIIISMFNAEKYIDRCVESLLLQDIPEDEYEILIFDDGSTDTSSMIVSNYAAKHPNIVLNKSINKGPYTQRNKGIKRAKGEYIYFVDADDYLTPNTLGAVLDFALANDLDVLGFGHSVTSKNDLEVAVKSPLTPEVNVITGAVYIAQHQAMRSELWWYLIKTAYLKKERLEFYTGYFMADFPFTFKTFLHAHRAAFYPRDIYRYFMSPNSITRKKSRENLRKIIDSTKKMLLEINRIIMQAEKKPTPPYEALVNLNYRRDKHAFWMVLFMIENDFDTVEVADYVRFLKAERIFPIRHYEGKDLDNRFKFKLISFLFHNKLPLNLYIRFRKSIKINK